MIKNDSFESSHEQESMDEMMMQSGIRASIRTNKSPFREDTIPK